MLLTWKEGKLGRAEVELLVENHHAEILPLVLRCKRFHHQMIEHAIIPGFKECGCFLIPLKGDPGCGTDEDNEVKGSTLVLVDPESSTVLVSATLQLQPLPHPQLGDVLGSPGLYCR